MTLAELVVVANRLPVDGQRGRGRRDDLAAVARRPGHRARAGDAAGRRRVGRLGRSAPTSSSSRSSSTARSSFRCALTAEEVELYYEGFSNDTIWPLYHDVIAPPRVPPRLVGRLRAGQPPLRRGRRRRGRRRARRSGCRTTSCSSCPRMLRELRPDLRDRLLPPHSLPGIRALSRSCRGAGRCSRDCSERT